MRILLLAALLLPLGAATGGNTELFRDDFSRLPPGLLSQPVGHRPFTGAKIYAPVRSPDYNESNYPTTVSMPAWKNLR